MHSDVSYKRLSVGHFRHWPQGAGEQKRALFVHELQVLLYGGDPAATRALPEWRAVAPA